MSARPVVLLAFSYDSEENPLPNVYQELRTLTSCFDRTNYVVEDRWKARQDEIEGVMAKYKSEVLIFHYGGHAGKNSLQVNDHTYDKDYDERTVKLIFPEGLAKNIGLCCQQIKLIFLNGCDTENQAPIFLQNGASAVIATSRPVKDRIARAFATLFYKHFTEIQNKNTLRQAYEFALNSILTNNKLEDLLDEKERSSIDAENENDEAPLYKLYIHPDGQRAAVEHETFQQWSAPPVQGGPVIIVDDPAKLKSTGVDENIYLNCNREKPYREFSEILKNKIEGKTKEPYFFIIHDEEEDCPDLLVERFERFGIPAYIPKSNFFHEIKLPDPDDLFSGDPSDLANQTRDKYKTALSELYKNCFGGQDAVQNQLCQLTRRSLSEPLLVVYHPFYPDFWHDPYDETHNELLHRQIKAFFEFYLGEFSRYLWEGFSERLIVLFSVKYYTPDPFFIEMFGNFEKESVFGNADKSIVYSRVKCYGNLPRVRRPDIDLWQKAHFEKSFFLVNDLFKKIDNSPVNDLSFFEAKEKLVDLINQFNSSRVRNAAT